MSIEKYIEQLNATTMEERLEALKALKKLVDEGAIEKPVQGIDVNNHIHTTYSFSPYSPSKALWRAYTAGLCTAGIMDHDSIGGAEEFIKAGEIIGLPTTIGMEMRVDFSKTPIAGRRINNTDQNSIAYMALHGIPHTEIKKTNDFMAPYRAKRNERNKKMVEKINERFAKFGIALDFEKDVLPLSMYNETGSITERHILFAMAHALVKRFGRGKQIVDFLVNEAKIEVGAKLAGYLSDENNAFYEYDLLGAIKSDVSSIYIDATDECMDVREALAFAKEIGAIPAYAYLGDVVDSVTGDKRAQKFEDDYLDQLFDVISDLGFSAVTYMPSRNTEAQLTRLRALCEKYSMFQISGEDINSPRQEFICKALQNPLYHNLIESTWALIGHERAATEDKSKGMFSPETTGKLKDLNERIEYFAKLGRAVQ